MHYDAPVSVLGQPHHYDNVVEITAESGTRDLALFGNVACSEEKSGHRKRKRKPENKERSVLRSCRLITKNPH
jgi:hypothetical protein